MRNRTAVWFVLIGSRTEARAEPTEAFHELRLGKIDRTGQGGSRRNSIGIVKNPGQNKKASPHAVTDPVKLVAGSSLENVVNGSGQIVLRVGIEGPVSLGDVACPPFPSGRPPGNRNLDWPGIVQDHNDRAMQAYDCSIPVRGPGARDPRRRNDPSVDDTATNQDQVRPPFE